MNEKKSTNWTAKKLAINALAIALVCVSTMVIQIPIPLGYMHLGNCCILLVSVYFGNMTGAGRRHWLLSGRSAQRLYTVDHSDTDHQRDHGTCDRYDRLSRRRRDPYDASPYISRSSGRYRDYDCRLYVCRMLPLRRHGSRFCPDPGTDHRRCDRTVAVLCDRICI